MTKPILITSTLNTIAWQFSGADHNFLLVHCCLLEKTHQPLLIWSQATLGHHSLLKHMECWLKDIIAKWPDTKSITFLSPFSFKTFSWINFQGQFPKEAVLNVCHPTYNYSNPSLLLTQLGPINHEESKNQQRNTEPERMWLMMWEPGWKQWDSSSGNGTWQELANNKLCNRKEIKQSSLKN